MSRTRKRVKKNKTFEQDSCHQKAQKEYEDSVESGKYWYVDFPPGNKDEFPIIERMLAKRKVKYKYCVSESGARCYRVKRKHHKGLPARATNQWDLIPYGLPHPCESGAWPFMFVFSLEHMYGPWLSPGPVQAPDKAEKGSSTPRSRPRSSARRRARPRKQD